MEKPKQARVAEAQEPRRGRGAPLRCVVPECPVGTVGDEAICRQCWGRLSWATRNAAGAAWRPPTTISPGWLRDALAELGRPVHSVHAGAALSPEELRFRPVALRILAQHEFERPDYDACTGGQHPCPWVSCPHHLYLDKMPGGTVHLNHPGKDVDELEETCAHDVVRKAECQFPEPGSGVSAERVAKLMGLKRGRVGQVVRRWREAMREALNAQPE
jgi:hypothetical protein